LFTVFQSLFSTNTICYEPFKLFRRKLRFYCQPLHILQILQQILAITCPAGKLYGTAYKPKTVIMHLLLPMLLLMICSSLPRLITTHDIFKKLDAFANWILEDLDVITRVSWRMHQAMRL